MVTSAETRETNRNGKRSRGSSPSSANNNSSNSKPPATVAVDDLTPETSDDDSRKHAQLRLNFQLETKNLQQLSDSKKNLGKAKNGKSEFEGELELTMNCEVIAWLKMKCWVWLKRSSWENFIDFADCFLYPSASFCSRPTPTRLFLYNRHWLRCF